MPWLEVQSAACPRPPMAELTIEVALEFVVIEEDTILTLAWRPASSLAWTETSVAWTVTPVRPADAALETLLLARMPPTAAPVAPWRAAATEDAALEMLAFRRAAERAGDGGVDARRQLGEHGQAAVEAG